MARAASLLLLAGGVVGIIITCLPHPDRINETAYWVIDASGVAVAMTVWLLRRHIPPPAYHLVSLAGILMVAGSIYYSGNDSGGALENELLFLWPILFAGYFFDRRGMIVQLVARRGHLCGDPGRDEHRRGGSLALGRDDGNPHRRRDLRPLSP